MIIALVVSTIAVLIAICLFGLGWINAVERRLEALEATGSPRSVSEIRS